MKKLPVFLVGAIIVLSLGLFLNSQDSSKSNKPINNQSTAVPYKLRFVLPNGKPHQIASVMAVEKGFFKKNNLDVEVVRAEKNSAAILIGNKADVTMAGPISYVAAAAQGVPLFWVAAITNNNHSITISNKKDINDIKVAGLQNSSLNRTGMVMRLESLKIDPNKVTFQDLGSEEAKLLAFKTKKVDIINISKVTWLLFARKNNLTSGDYTILVGDNQEDANPSLSGLIVRGELLKDHQDVVENTAKALIEAENWIKGNRDEAADIFARFSEMPKEDAQVYVDGLIEDTKDLEFTPSTIKAQVMIDLLALDNPDVKKFKPESYISLVITDSLKKSGFYTQYNLR